jgi:hypothetical protein
LPGQVRLGIHPVGGAGRAGFHDASLLENIRACPRDLRVLG